MSDVVELTQRLVRVPSITPDQGPGLDVVEAALAPLGFSTERLTFSHPDTPDVDNMFSTWGTGSRHLCFLGHTDVVPIAHPEAWAHEPFGAEVQNGVLTGRGANDMKGAIAAFICALERFLPSAPAHAKVSVFLTGDEEGPGHNGAKRVCHWIKEQGITLDAGLVGEPTSRTALGDMCKIGRRGSLHGVVIAEGTTGHVAYPHLAENPVTHLIAALHALKSEPLDDGNAHFPPSNLEVLDLTVGNDVDNVIPQRARGRFNVRFNSEHTPQSLMTIFDERVAAVSERIRIEYRVSGESFLTPLGALSDALVGAVEAVTGTKPELSTSGGTSDARFLKDLCPVVEFGLPGASMHKANEHVRVDDLHMLTDVYLKFLHAYFA